MRSRETEWSYPVLRFLGALFVPPVLGTVVIVLSLLFSGTLSISVVFSSLFAYGYTAIITTTVPSIIFFLVLEKVYETKETIRNSRIRFSVIGLVMGVIFGTGIGIHFQGIPTFLNLGSAVGFATAYFIFPTSTQQNQPFN